MASGTVLEEAAVPLLQLMVGELCVFSQVVQDLRPQLAVLFPHDAQHVVCLVLLPSPFTSPQSPRRRLPSFLRSCRGPTALINILV